MVDKALQARKDPQRKLVEFEATLAVKTRPEHDDETFRATLNAFADELIDNVTDDADQDWVMAELNSMLHRHGLHAVDYDPPGPL